jgi:hypothetical protein
MVISFFYQNPKLRSDLRQKSANILNINLDWLSCIHELSVKTIYCVHIYCNKTFRWFFMFMYFLILIIFIATSKNQPK